MPNPWDSDPIVGGAGGPSFIPPNPMRVAQQQADEARKQAAEARAQQDQIRQQQQLILSQKGDQRTESNQTFGDAGKLRDDFAKQAQTKEYQTIIRQYATALKTKPTPTGDQALITAYAKMLDPTSVVREQEFNTVANADSAIGKAYAKLSKELGMEDSGLLRPEIRERVREEMLNLTKGYNQSYNQQRQFYSGLAEKNGIAPADVVGPHLGEPYLPQIEQALKQQYEARNRPVVQNDPRGEPQQDGTFVKDSGVYDRGGGFLGLSGSVTDDGPGGGTPPTPTPAPNGGYSESLLGQGMYGLNEGLASTLGAPADLTAMGLNLIPKGINAVANTNLPSIEKPFLGGDWWKGAFTDLGSIGPESDNATNQFVRRTAQSVGASAIPAAGTSSRLAQAAKAIGVAAGGGVGAATAQQVFPGNPLAEFAGEVAGSGLTSGGLLGSSSRMARKAAIAAVPSRDELKNQASNLYNSAESRGIVAGPNVTGNLAGRMEKIADDEKMRWPNGKVDPNYTRAGANLEMMQAHSGHSIDPRQIQVLRENIMDSVRGTEGKEQRIARQMLGAFDDETIPLAPELADARRISSRYLQSDEINRARQLAEPRAAQYSGSGMENALRTEFRKLDRGMINGAQNFNPAAAEAIKNVDRGTPMTNALRAVSKFAPTGVVSGSLSAGVPFAIGNAMGGPAVGAAAGATSLGLGSLAKRGLTSAVEREAQMADILARNGGALKVAPAWDEETKKALRAAILGQGSQYIPR